LSHDKPFFLFHFFQNLISMYFNTQTTSFNADLYTPVKIYLSLRNTFRKTCLLESNDYHSRQNSRSFIGLDPLLEIIQQNGTVQIIRANHTDKIKLDPELSYAKQVQSILDDFTFEQSTYNGFFGRMNFEYTLHDETHISKHQYQSDLPDLHLFIFRNIIVIDHFTNEGSIIENSLDGIFTSNSIEDFMSNSGNQPLPFELFGNERAEYSDTQFENMVKKGIEHCQRGDVFQLVLSNRFEQSFFGDDFEVYRQLRRLNPSPYLFFFDFESYRLFGSSPEAQLVIKNGEAEIHPIAGTVPRTGVKETDNLQLEFLINDEKENAEHTMLVDLARNDLSRDCNLVNVSSYKEVQHFSHVTHLVSKVTGQLRATNNFEALCNSFPAGTLSGTPKPKALELIAQYESKPRDFYGGTIGILTPKEDLNMAIVIRSILSKNNTLYYRAGAGIVLDSDPKRETQEVHHKLGAVRRAIHKTANQFTTKKKTK